MVVLEDADTDAPAATEATLPCSHKCPSTHTSARENGRGELLSTVVAAQHNHWVVSYERGGELVTEEAQIDARRARVRECGDLETTAACYILTPYLMGVVHQHRQPDKRRARRGTRTAG